MFNFIFVARSASLSPFAIASFHLLGALVLLPSQEECDEIQIEIYITFPHFYLVSARALTKKWFRGYLAEVLLNVAMWSRSKVEALEGKFQWKGKKNDELAWLLRIFLAQIIGFGKCFHFSPLSGRREEP